MKLLKKVSIAALLFSVSAIPALAATEITSAPVSVLANTNYDVSEGCTLLTRSLKKGDKDAEVLALGKFLKDKKYFKGSPSQNFTATLQRALEDYQLDEGLIGRNAPNFGVVTAPTRDRIAEQTCKKRDIDTPATSCVFITRALQVGNNALQFTAENRLLQRFLVQTGYLSSTFVTGHFGPLTREALARFQYDNGIVASLSVDGAGIVGPKTRQFIAQNTCGSAEAQKTETPTKIGYKISLSTRTGLKITENESERIFRINLTPQEQNAQIHSLEVQVETPSAVSPWNYIDGIELFQGGKILSRLKGGSNIWTKIAGETNMYLITLNGSSDYLERNTEHPLNVNIIPKASALSLSPKTFSAHIPSQGFKVQFSDTNLKPKGVESWGSTSQKSTFSIGKEPTAPAPTPTPTPDPTPNPTPNPTPTPTPTTNPTPVVKAPQLNWVSPDEGSFGQDLTLRGVNFHASSNKVKLVHVQTGAERIIHNVTTKNNQITFKFPGKNTEFQLPKGKITGETGNYRVSVLSNGLESNWIRYRVKNN